MSRATAANGSSPPDGAFRCKRSVSKAAIDLGDVKIAFPFHRMGNQAAWAPSPALPASDLAIR